MRIVGEEEFLSLPSSTVYSKFTPYVFDKLCLKGETDGNSFTYLSLTDSVSCSDYEFFDAVDNAAEFFLGFDGGTSDCLSDCLFDGGVYLLFGTLKTYVVL